MILQKNQQAFFDLVKAGLWEQDVRPLLSDEVDFSAILRLAEEQSIVGLVAQGLEIVADRIPQGETFSFIGRTIQLEGRNTRMNQFIAALFDNLKNAGVNALLVKGQGIAQCYNRPLWRMCGDVDLFLDEKNYLLAKDFLSAKAKTIEDENLNRLHQAMTISSWEVELHGTLRSGLRKRIDKIIDFVQEDTFRNNHVRVWRNNDVDILLPAPDNDVIFVFTHILQHFFNGGIGLRQLCDWSRLLWTYRDEIDKVLLGSRLREMGLMSEWKAFAAVAVDWLGIPAEAMPLYDDSRRWKRKAGRIVDFIIETGNFGHNRDMSYIRKRSFFVRKTISLWRHTRDSVRRFFIFPLDSMIVWWSVFRTGIKVALKGMG